MTSLSGSLSQRAARVLLATSVAMSLCTATVAASEGPDATVPPSPVASDDIVAYPLPDLVGDPSDLSTVSLEPESEVGWTIGVRQPYDLGHCGILSPVDVDGSLWAPVGGNAPDGGPIDHDDDISQLINATPGTLELTATDRAEFVSSTDVRIYFERAPAALDYFLCM